MKDVTWLRSGVVSGAICALGLVFAIPQLAHAEDNSAEGAAALSADTSVAELSEEEPIKPETTADGSTPGVFGGLYFGLEPYQSADIAGGVNIAEYFGRGTGHIGWASPATSLSVDTSSHAVDFRLGFGLNLGYFPPILTYAPSDEFAVAPGFVFKGGATFMGGWGGGVSLGPEVAVRYNSVRFSAGYSVGVGGFARTLGTLDLASADYFITDDYEIEDSQGRLKTCSDSEFADKDNSLCVRHDSRSELRMSAQYFSHSPYVRIGYGFVGLSLGYRFAGSSYDEFLLRNTSEKETQVRGPDFDALEANTDFGGLFVELEIFNMPF